MNAKLQLARPWRAVAPAHRTAATSMALLATAAVAATVIGTGSSPRMLVLLLLAPVIEEAIFRAGVQEALVRNGMRAWQCVGITALAFAVAHVLVRQDWAALWLGVPAIVTGVVYQRSRSVAACVVLHAAMNAVWLGWPTLESI